MVLIIFFLFGGMLAKIVDACVFLEEFEHLHNMLNALLTLIDKVDACLVRMFGVVF